MLKLKQNMKFHKLFLKYTRISYFKINIDTSFIVFYIIDNIFLAYKLQYNTLFMKFAIIDMYLKAVAIIFKK